MGKNSEILSSISMTVNARALPAESALKELRYGLEILKGLTVDERVQEMPVVDSFISCLLNFVNRSKWDRRMCDSQRLDIHCVEIELDRRINAIDNLMIGLEYDKNMILLLLATPAIASGLLNIKLNDQHRHAIREELQRLEWRQTKCVMDFLNNQDRPNEALQRSP